MRASFTAPASKEFAMNSAAANQPWESKARHCRWDLTPRPRIFSAIATLALLCLTACGGGDSGFSPSPQYTIGGTLSGLTAGSQVVLADNGSDTLTLNANGAFTFKTAVASGAGYSVSVTTQPMGQTCTVANATGTNITADVTSVNVVCAGPLQYAYVVNSGDNTVSQYTVGAAGSLVPMSAPTVGTGTAPQSMAVDPLGRYAYVPNLNDNTVSQYTIGTGGLLVPMSSATVPSGVGPWAIAIDPTGSYAYVVNSSDRTISQYTLGAGGALTPMTPATIATGNQPLGITIDPSGQYA
jgi:DNA-binding beta-propeller fold protein YncE